MVSYCETCRREYPPETKKCPLCGGPLEPRPTDEELQKQNDDFTVVNTLLL